MIETDEPFASLGQANSHHLKRATVAWSAANDEAKLAALWRATDYIADSYTLISPDDIDDYKLARACATLAADALTGDLTGPLEARDVTASTKAGDGIGSIAMTFGERNEDRYPHVTRILAPIATCDLDSASTSALTSGRIVL